MFSPWPVSADCQVKREIVVNAAEESRTESPSAQGFCQKRELQVQVKILRTKTVHSLFKRLVGQ